MYCYRAYTACYQYSYGGYFMSDATFGAEQMSCRNESTDSGCESVCVNASRIYDSCGAKDCLSNLPLVFTAEDQAVIDTACSVRIGKVSIITSTVDVSPVAFHRGFYAVDIVFYFVVSVEVFTNTGAIPTTVNGLATYGKRVVLYGGDGAVKTFTSDSPVVCDNPDDCNCVSASLPRASVQISNPMGLSAVVNTVITPINLPCGPIPECVTQFFGAELVPPTERYVAVTIGIFTITQLERNVQLMIPSYDFCVPRKECAQKTDDPCEMFSKIEFPTASFFPPQVGENQKLNKHFECNCEY